MSASRCPESLSGDHAWPAELDQDARCQDCGLWYPEYVQEIGEAFDVSARTPVTPRPANPGVLILAEVIEERERQNLKWGPQRHPDGTGSAFDVEHAEQLKKLCDDQDALGTTTWRGILHEEVFEAFAETDPVRLREELVQVAAVALAWLEDIDSRGST